ncbi:Urea transporter 1, partial [Melipona quadrifasciata]
DNATSDATIGDVSFIGENATGVHIDWGMVKFALNILHIFQLFHGVIVSASQVLAVESVFTGAVVYLACLVYSPITAGFAFFGALIGSLAGLMLDVQIDEIYTGLWGYNTFLTGASLGGTFFVLNGQTAAATIVAIVYTVIVQYAILFFFRNLKLPIFTLPFVLVTSLFLKLRSNSGDKTFPQPPPISFSRTERRDYITSQQAQLIQQVCVCIVSFFISRPCNLFSRMYFFYWQAKSAFNYTVFVNKSFRYYSYGIQHFYK